MTREVDYQFTALLIAHVFGWTIPQVMALTWPQFEYITYNICRLQYWHAKNEIYFGISAAFGSDKNRDNLFDCAGDFFLKAPEPDMSYTPEQLAAAEARMAEIQRKRSEADNV